MTSKKIRRKALFTDGVLWLITILAGIMFLLPKAVSLIQVREKEKIEALQAEAAEQSLKESQIKVEYLGSDPDALKKIDEQRALSDRK
ncbi:MAG: hypothetical protein OTI37_03665 [Planctomycetota bacterium]|nr:hypothetical protein [Planctomycetota bacterium]